MKALEVPTHPREGISLEALDLATQKPGAVKAALVISNFSNPLGSLMSEDKKRKLVGLLEGRGIPLIEDDIYGDLYFGRSRPFVAKAFETSGGVLLCSSFTKSLAPGFRVGWIAPGRFQQQVELLKFINSIATPELPQLAIAEFMADGGYDHHLRKLRTAFAGQVQRTSEAVAAHFPPACRITQPAGGFVLWVEMPAAVDAVRLFEMAREACIAIAPGSMFTHTGKFRNFMRLNCGNVWSPQLERAILRIGEMCKRLAEA